MESNPHEVSFDNVWGEKSDELLDEITGLWSEAGVNTGNQPPIERAKQALLVARKDGKIVAISTAFTSHVANMKSNFFMFRAMTHPDFRIPGLLEMITSQSIEYLESIYQETVPYCIGVMAAL